MISRPEHTIVISSLGDIDEGLFESVGREIRRVFGFRTKTLALLEDLDFALDAARHQYYSTRILAELARRAPVEALKILAIVDVDLFIPIMTHVYGEAQLGGKACILSIHRLRKNLPPVEGRNAFEQRVVKEALHELGHTFDLRHCPDHRCIMHYCRSERDVDRKSDQFCRYCNVLLEDGMNP